MTHRLATIHNVTDDRQTTTTDDGHNSVPIARPLVRSAKKQKVEVKFRIQKYI